MITAYEVSKNPGAVHTYLARFDLNASGNINLLDVFILRPFFGLTCTLPS